VELVHDEPMFCQAPLMHCCGCSPSQCPAAERWVRTKTRVLVWRVGKAEVVLARIDWAWEAHAIGIGGPGGTCQSTTINDSWALKPGAPVVPPKAGPAAAAVMGAAAGAPVMAPTADPTKWVLC
jgi:hypothetical protein